MNTHIITYYYQSDLVLLTCSDLYTGPSPFCPNPGILTHSDPCLAHYAQRPHPFLLIYKTPLLSTQCPIMQIRVGIQTIIPFWPPRTPALAPMYKVPSSTAILFRPLCQFPCLGAPPMTPMPSKMTVTCLPGAVNTHMICLYPCLVPEHGIQLEVPFSTICFWLLPYSSRYNIILKTISLMSISFLFTFLCHYIVTPFLHLLFTKIMTSITKTGIHQVPSTMPWELSFSKKFYFL
jgi:hypothetical protein